jgi:benzodiazapine receptor
VPARHVHRRRAVHEGRAEEAVVEVHGGTNEGAGGTSSGVELIGFSSATCRAASWLLLGPGYNDQMNWLDWYNSLAKPPWTPAPSTISLIWMILYPIILVSFGFVFVQAFRGKVPWRFAVPFAVNLVANLLFMPIFSGLRNVPLAAVDIVIVWVTIICCILVVWPVYRWVAVAQVPYFVWVSIATVIQLSITWMNW